MAEEIVKVVSGPVKTFVIDKIFEYLKYTRSYEDNMSKLITVLDELSAAKLDTDTKVMADIDRLRVMTRVTMNWLTQVQELIVRDEMKMLLKDNEVAKIVVKMMDQCVMEKLFEEDRETFDILVQAVLEKFNEGMIIRDGEESAVDAQERDDYWKVAEIAMEVMKGAVEDFKKFMKRDDAVVAAEVVLLNDANLKKLEQVDKEMAKIFSNAEGISRKRIELPLLKQKQKHGYNIVPGEDELPLLKQKHGNNIVPGEDELPLLKQKHGNNIVPGEDELPLLKQKHGNNIVQPATTGKNIIKEKVGNLRKHLGSLMTFLNDENFKKELGDGARLGLEVFNAILDDMSNKVGSDHHQIQDKAKQHRYCGWCVVCVERYSYRHDMSQSAERLIEVIKHMITKCPKGPEVTRPKRADELKSVSNDFMEGLESREKLIDKILIALKSDKVLAVGVFGMGGCGKTTLSKEIANNRASDLFDKRLVIEISEAPDIRGIQDQIAEGIDLSLHDFNSVTQRARAIYNGLLSVKKRKILIILDNMWKKLNLDEVGIPRESASDFCCKLVITTREEEVCRVMGVQPEHTFEVGMLKEREAINLFENQSGKKVVSGKYQPVAERLLSKCGGLPLSIVATASALRGKELSAWCRFAEESEKPISGQVSSKYRETYSILETSYKLIDIEEKIMFLFLACLSPLNSALSVDYMMRYGIGLNLFQHVNNLSEATERALDWTNELVSSSLLIKDENSGQLRIHDVVRASLISFVEKGKGRLTLVESIPRWISKEAFEKFKAISLLSGRDFSIMSGVEAPMLEILLLKGELSSTTLTSNFFKGMTNLKVLSLSNINFKSGLPESMGQLERLKTLHLHHCHLKDIKLIGKLVNLLVLSLRGSTFEELATEIGELYNLRLLDMGGCKGMTSIPANVLSRLSCLEGIYMFNSFDNWADDEGADNKASINELVKLSHLNVLEMEVQGSSQLFNLNGSLLVSQLGKFRLHIGGFERWNRHEVQQFRCVLELNDIPSNCDEFLRALLNKTNYLQIDNCRNESFILQLDEEGFKEMEYLRVKYCLCAKFLVSSVKQNKSMGAFANLEYLGLECLPSLTRICEGKSPAGIFSKLTRLILSNLSNLKYGLPLTSVPLLLVEVFVYVCESLEVIAFEEKALVEREPNKVWLPYLKSVTVDQWTRRLSSILGEAENSLQEGKSFFNSKNIFPSLETLRTSVCSSNITLWSRECHVSSFQNLKVLGIHKSDGLESLGSPSLFAALLQLEELKISNCDNLQEVITKEDGHEVGEPVIVFPSLKRLKMKMLSKVQWFYGGSYKLEFPNLKSLILSETTYLVNFDGSENSTALFSDKIVFPSLEELVVQNVSDKVVGLWNWSSSDVQVEIERQKMKAPNLQQLTVGNIPIPSFVSHNLSHLNFVNLIGNKTLFSIAPVNREALWTYSQVPKLENLSVYKSDILEILFEDEDDDATIRLCGQLTAIRLSEVPKLKYIPLKLLKNIRSLSLCSLHLEYVFSPDLFILQLLENLEISQCSNMKAVIKDELVDGADRVFVFPRLKSLALRSLSINYFADGNDCALHLPSLERLEIFHCIETRSFCSGPFKAPKLKQVELRYCGQMRCFASENANVKQELPSLESVTILQCRNLVSFSPVSLAAPKLHDVYLLGCNKMKWFSPGDPNNDNVLYLPSLEKVSVYRCYNIESFSTGRIKAPKLSGLIVDLKDFSKRANDELQILLASLGEIPR